MATDLDGVGAADLGGARGGGELARGGARGGGVREKGIEGGATRAMDEWIRLERAGQERNGKIGKLPLVTGEQENRFACGRCGTAGGQEIRFASGKCDPAAVTYRWRTRYSVRQR